ncbi:MAG: AAA family ATPase [Candidatus Krumholzibacteriota bacterium]|nr:AAA family ATPase [Candidatus Krumholzibacteriota bacterium]
MSEISKYKELSADKLRWECSENSFKFKTTADVKPCNDIIGQDRALMSIKMGLDLEHRGYNIFITGLVGTGRKTTIKHLLERLERKDRVPPDICYMNNFRDSNLPVCIELDAGDGVRLAAEMEGLIFNLKKNIPAVFKSEYYTGHRKKLVERIQAKQKKIVNEFEAKISKEGFTMISLQVGPVIKPQLVPVIDGNPVDYQHVTQLVEEGKISPEQFEKMKEAAERLSEEMSHVYSEMKELEEELRARLEKFDVNTVHPVIHEMVADIDRRFQNSVLRNTLGGVEKALIKKLDLFRAKGMKEPNAEQSVWEGNETSSSDNPFREFMVNVIVDNSEAKAPPVVIENFPSLKNIFGMIEREFTQGGWAKADHMSIRAGSFHRANGGYLVLNARDIFMEPGVWQTLKRTLKSAEVTIQNYDPFGFMSSSALKPKSVQVKSKIVLIGDAFMYYLLQAHDEDFRKIFKIRADFDREVDKSKTVISQYAGFARSLGDRENLFPLDRSGMSAVVEYGVRLAGRQSKLSTKFSMIADIIRESHYHAQNAGKKVINREHVREAIRCRIKRVNLLEEKIQERFDDGTILIQTSGAVVGQVNALSVYDMGDYSFGRPSRITASTSLGNAGVINIEREADLSGNTHNKGVLILSGYLNGKYGNENPIAINASLCFEQSYGGVDGDSASSTELYAILSSISGLPLRQDIAVTGSINQKGEIQPIGGVNQKIEGFFDVCQARGLKGTEGVIIPWQNVPDLMLEDRVVEAVSRNKFHIYPIKTVDQGISILTGLKAGNKLRSGRYSKESVNDLVQRNLYQMALKWKKFGAAKKEK